MLIEVDILSENIFDKCTINTTSFLNMCEIIRNKFLIPENEQEWYFNNIQIDTSFILKKGKYSVFFSNDNISIKIKIDNKLKVLPYFKYSVFFSNDNISIKIKIDNKLKVLPYLSKNLKICDLKNILTIKDNIYLNEKMLSNDKTLTHYNINNNDILNVKKVNIIFNIV